MIRCKQLGLTEYPRYTVYEIKQPNFYAFLELLKLFKTIMMCKNTGIDFLAATIIFCHIRLTRHHLLLDDFNLMTAIS